MFKTIHTLCFDTIDSTHTWCKKNIHTLDPDGLTSVTALEQTAGIGRHQRKWLSPKGLNIHATFCFTLPAYSPFIGNLGQLLSLSACSVLEKYGLSPEIKWPNDIRIQEKKIAGVLCDTLRFQEKLGIVLSIGLNVNMSEELLTTINQPATSLAQLSGHLWNLDTILEELREQFMADFAILCAQGFSAFQESYQNRLAFKGQVIRCFDGIKFLEGICHGILPDGRLELLLSNDQKVYLTTGEVGIPL